MDLTSEIRKNVGDAIFKEIMVENFLELKYLHSLKNTPQNSKQHPPFPTCTHGPETTGHKGK